MKCCFIQVKLYLTFGTGSLCKVRGRGGVKIMDYNFLLRPLFKVLPVWKLYFEVCEFIYCHILCQNQPRQRPQNLLLQKSLTSASFQPHSRCCKGRSTLWECHPLVWEILFLKTRASAPPATLFQVPYSSLACYHLGVAMMRQSLTLSLTSF